MLVSHTDPLFPTDPASLGGIEKLCHYCAFGEGSTIFVKRFHIDEARAAISDRMIVVIVMCLLDDNFVLQSLHVRGDIYNRRFVTPSNARCCRQLYCSGSARSDQCALTPEALGKILVSRFV